MTGLAIPATRSFIRSVGQALRGHPDVIEANPRLHPQPIPPCKGQAVPAWGIGRPFPGAQCAEVNTGQAPSAGALKESSSRCRLEREHRDAPVNDNPRGTRKLSGSMRIAIAEPVVAHI